MSLPIASLLGAIYALAALAVGFYAVPNLWTDFIGSSDDAEIPRILRAVAQVAVFLGLLWVGFTIAGDSLPRGIRGGTFLMILAAIVIFFIVRAFALAFEGEAGKVVSGIVLVALLFFVGRFFTGQTGQGWMVALEEQGWFSFHQYKRALGVRVRRLTILGILLVGGSGLYSMYYQGVLPNQWTLSMPFDWSPITLMTNARIVILISMGLLTLWIAFRAVNVPTFAEFLIATEAEMNKVSWTSRKRLAQDTVVVLITTLIMTLFLLVVDLFWGWLLSRNTVGVLPSRSTTPEKHLNQEAKW